MWKSLFSTKTKSSSSNLNFPGQILTTAETLFISEHILFSIFWFSLKALVGSDHIFLSRHVISNKQMFFCSYCLELGHQRLPINIFGISTILGLDISFQKIFCWNFSNNVFKTFSKVTSWAIVSLILSKVSWAIVFDYISVFCLIYLDGIAILTVGVLWTMFRRNVLNGLWELIYKFTFVWQFNVKVFVCIIFCR